MTWASRRSGTIGLDIATTTVAGGELVVLPTDTVYGLGTDAFNADAVAALLAAKGRGRDMPVPVLVGSPRTLDGIATDLSDGPHAGRGVLAGRADPRRLGSAVAAVGPRRHRRDRRGPDAAAPGRPGAAGRHRPDGGEQRQPQRLGAGHDRRRGDRAARRVRVDLPGRRSVRRGRALDDRRRHRLGAPGAAGGRGERRGAARGRRRPGGRAE